MKAQFNIKSAVFVSLQWLGALVGFLFCLVITNALLRLPKNIVDATPPAGFLSMPIAMLFNGAVNATILIWAARRSSYKGLALWMILFALSFGAQTFQTQVETGYFLSAFPLLTGNFELYRLILRGLITSLLFTGLVVLLVGGFRRKARAETQLTVQTDQTVKAGAWLAVVYIVLYALFGYYVAWQLQELRLFYGGPAELNSFVSQWGSSLMSRPELPVFQYFRGILWLLCLIPLFKGFTGKRVELVILSALALAYLPTAQLAFANPLMPAGVSLGHFWEASISTGIFGALCAWFVPTAVAKP
jgi:hypothetical protein